jgi:hypothetical protein
MRLSSIYGLRGDGAKQCLLNRRCEPWQTSMLPYAIQCTRIYGYLITPGNIPELSHHYLCLHFIKAQLSILLNCTAEFTK